MNKKTLKCEYCNDTTEIEDTGITGYVCEECWLKKATKTKRQKWKDIRTGEIVTQFKILDIQYMEKIEE